MHTAIKFIIAGALIYFTGALFADLNMVNASRALYTIGGCIGTIGAFLGLMGMLE